MKDLIQNEVSTYDVVKSCDNRNFVLSSYKRHFNGEVSDAILTKLLAERNINERNACEFYNCQRGSKDTMKTEKNVYEMLLSFVKRNPGYDYYVDELPIILSPASKSLYGYVIINTIQKEYNL